MGKLAFQLNDVAGVSNDEAEVSAVPGKESLTKVTEINGVLLRAIYDYNIFDPATATYTCSTGWFDPAMEQRPGKFRITVEFTPEE